MFGPALRNYIGKAEKASPFCKMSARMVGMRNSAYAQRWIDRLKTQNRESTPCVRETVPSKSCVGGHGREKGSPVAREARGRHAMLRRGPGQNVNCGKSLGGSTLLKNGTKGGGEHQASSSHPTAAC